MEQNNHPNRRDFLGILTFTDTPSDAAPAGARGHKVSITGKTMEACLPTILGMAVNYSKTDTHDRRSKCGIITSAWMELQAVMVSGYIFPMEYPELISISASSEELGMSFEVENAYITDMRSKVWDINKLTFVGAAIGPREKLAWKKTEFVVL